MLVPRSCSSQGASQQRNSGRAMLIRASRHATRFLPQLGGFAAVAAQRRVAAASVPAAAAAAAAARAAADGHAIILGIESSCDDTAAAVITADGRVLGEAIAGQADIHAPYGGVHPSLASRAHAAAIDRVVSDALAAASLTPSQLTAVAVTVGPGLSLCLDVGVRKARALSREAGLPLVPVHHMEAHALVVRLAAKQAETAGASSCNSSSGTTSSSGASSSSNGSASAWAVPPDAARFPFLCLLVSGGHNLLVLVRGIGDYLQLGSTLDDALGEAYDKVARILGLELKPHGGAVLEALARKGDPGRYSFAVPMQRHPNCDFSFAGLKTGVRLCAEKELPPVGDPGREQVAADIAASFQAVAVRHLCQRVRRGIGWAQEALGEPVTSSSKSSSKSRSSSSLSSSTAGVEPRSSGLRHLVVAGGVASNQYIRQQLTEVAAAAGLELVVPPPRWCTDNGVMVAWAGIERLQLGLVQPPLPPLELAPGEQQEWIELRPRWPLTSERHSGSTPPQRSTKSPAKQARSLTDETREALAGAGSGEAEGSGCTAEAAAAAAAGA